MGQVDEEEEEIEELINEQQHHHKLVRQPKQKCAIYSLLHGSGYIYMQGY